MVWIPCFDYWGLGLIPGLGTRILQVSRCGKQTNKQTKSGFCPGKYSVFYRVHSHGAVYLQNKFYSILIQVLF